MPPNTVKVDRSTMFGNPYSIEQFGGAKEAVRQFALRLDEGCPPRPHPESYMGKIIAALPTLRGKNLACWCPLDQPCHADELLKAANAPQEGGGS